MVSSESELCSQSFWWLFVTCIGQLLTLTRWAGEEEGLLGSDHYVYSLSKEENLKIRLFMDYDMMASPNFAYQIYNATNAVNPAGSEELRDLYIDWYKDQGLNYSFIPFDGRSDYDGFIRNDIPGGGIATGAEGIKTKQEEKEFGGKAGDWYDPCKLIFPEQQEKTSVS